MGQGIIPATTSNVPPLSPPMSSGVNRASDTVPFSSGMIGNLLPTIPNLQFGFQYFFGAKARSVQANADYLFPLIWGNDAVLFGEAHGNYWDFGRKPTGGASNRVDLSLGGGYRRILSGQVLFGINGFYDTSRLFNQWYSSGGVGLEMAANIGSSDAVDLNANWYGNLFASNNIFNAFRNKGGSYDIQAGYSHAMFDSSLDLRLKVAGYRFDTGNPVYGYITGADLTTRDGMFTLRYEYGNDRINGSWNNIGAFVNVGFQMENIIKGESPVSMPEPIFKSPRNLRRMLTQKVKRDWNQQYAPGRVAGGRGALCRFIAWSDGYKEFSTPVPYGDLDPEKYVTVTFHATWVGGTDPQNFSLRVYGPDNFPAPRRYVSGEVWLKRDGDAFVQLCGKQSDFAGDDPISLGFGTGGGGGGFQFTDIIVCFNQSGSCP